MVIGGAELTVGISKDTQDPDDFSMALKVVVFGMDGLETTEIISKAIMDTLLTLDPELEIKEVDNGQSDFH
jgi:hypothetical protein